MRYQRSPMVTSRQLPSQVFSSREEEEEEIDGARSDSPRRCAYPHTLAA
ncbi:hypothetical protein OAS39_06935 [Pirellulales bacterium]|nr:hypothetical protein [Pirellulales bacterium]